MPTAPIMIIAGTNRPNSNALKIAHILLGHYQAAKVLAEVFSLTELPKEVFDASAYSTKPPGMVVIQNRVLAAPGLHVVTPEYNGGPPGVLKYFIDMLKFPESFDRKPVAFTGESAGMFGALRPVEQLQAIFGYRNAYLYPERVFIPGIGQKLTPEGKLNDPAINDRLAQQAIGFAKFVATLAVA